jgi:hypothetical protein
MSLVIESGFYVIELYRSLNMVGWIVADISREKIADNFDSIRRVDVLEGIDLDSFGGKGDIGIWITLVRWGKGLRGPPGASTSLVYARFGYVVNVVDNIETRSDGFVVLTVRIGVEEIRVEKGF